MVEIVRQSGNEDIEAARKEEGEVERDKAG